MNNIKINTMIKANSPGIKSDIESIKKLAVDTFSNILSLIDVSKADVTDATIDLVRDERFYNLLDAVYIIKTDEYKYTVRLNDYLVLGSSAPVTKINLL